MEKPTKRLAGSYRAITAGLAAPRARATFLARHSLADLYEHWQIHGIAAIKKVCNKHPAEYLKVIASILPKDVNMNVSPFEHMTDAELNASIKRLLADAAGREGSGPTEH